MAAWHNREVRYIAVARVYHLFKTEVGWVRVSVAKRQTRVTVTASLLAALTSESDKVRLQGCVGIVLLIPCSFGSSI